MLNDILKDIDFAADWLPPGQEPIITSRVKRFKVFCHLIADLDQDYPTIGLVTGAAGLAADRTVLDFGPDWSTRWSKKRLGSTPTDPRATSWFSNIALTPGRRSLAHTNGLTPANR